VRGIPIGELDRAQRRLPPTISAVIGRPLPEMAKVFNPRRSIRKSRVAFGR
jgi:hypothetical protein